MPPTIRRWSRLPRLKPIFVSFTLPQEHLDEIREYQAEGAARRCAPTAATAATLLSEGKLTLIDNPIDQTTGTIHLKASFDNPDERCGRASSSMCG